MPSPLSTLKTNPSHALLAFSVSPAKLSSIVSAISLAAPFASINLASNSPTLTPVCANITPAVAPLLPNKSIATAFLSVALFICNIASSKVNPCLDNSKNIFLNAVPAELASKPLSDKVPNKAVVLSKLTPAVFAVAPTIGKAVANF